MVRLRAPKLEVYHLLLQGFNSKMVRLREREALAQTGALFSFNSKMVRLREWYKPTYLYRPYLFQFQDGAIKRADYCWSIDSSFKFQFQDGAIKRCSD